MKYLFVIILVYVFPHFDCNKKEKEIVIHSVNESIDVGCEDSQMRESCSEWNLSKDQVKLFFSLSDKINTKEKHDNYSYFPCEIKGHLTLNDTIFEYVINGGAYSELYYKDKLMYVYGCADEKCESLVLMGREEIVRD